MRLCLFVIGGEAFKIVVYVTNRSPTLILQKSCPLQTLINQQPDYHAFKDFGCACYHYLRTYNKHKLEFRSEQCSFLGYISNHKGCICLALAGKTLYFQACKI